jgi:hypothetical protein
VVELARSQEISSSSAPFPQNFTQCRQALGPDSRLYGVDWIPLEESFRKERYGCIAEFEADIFRLSEASPSYQYFQKEIHYAHPLVLGGDPKATPVMLDQESHAKACRFFNQICRRVKAKATQAKDAQ